MRTGAVPKTEINLICRWPGIVTRSCALEAESKPHDFHTPESSFRIARENEAARAADASACEMQAFETVV